MREVARRRARRRLPPSLLFGTAGAATTALAAALGIQAGLPPLAAYLLGVNAATFALYAYDKAVAGRHRLRVPEAVLHALALLGGSPAAVLGQRLLRHKTVKASFRSVGRFILAVQVALLLAWAAAQYL